MGEKPTAVEVQYQFEPYDGPSVGAPVMWLERAFGLAQASPGAILSTPIASTSRAVSALLTGPPAETQVPSHLGHGGTRLRCIRLPGGAELVRHYDSQGRLCQVAYPDGVRLHYQANGTTVRAFPGVPSAITHVLDNSGRVTSLQYWVNARERLTFTYGWDERGRMSAIQYPDGQGVTYSWDESGRLAEATAGARRISYGWSATGRLSEISYACAATRVELRLRTKPTRLLWTAGEQADEVTVCPLGFISRDDGAQSIEFLTWDGSRTLLLSGPSGRPEVIYSPSGATFLIRMPSGDISSVVQPNGSRFLWYSSCAVGVTAIVGASSVTMARRDLDGSLINLRDAAGLYVRYSHVRLKGAVLPQRISSPVWGQFRIRYDASHRLARFTCIGRGECEFRYALRGQLQSVTASGGSQGLLETARSATWFYALHEFGAGTLLESLQYLHLVG